VKECGGQESMQTDLLLQNDICWCPCTETSFQERNRRKWGKMEKGGIGGKGESGGTGSRGGKG
jgi:hypothetical protein